MINRQMQSCTVWQKNGETDEWGAPSQDETMIATINIAINVVDTLNIKNSIEYGEVTHLGLTSFRGLKKGHVLRTLDKVYTVEKQPNEVTRLSQVYLKEVV